MAALKKELGAAFKPEIFVPYLHSNFQDWREHWEESGDDDDDSDGPGLSALYGGDLGDVSIPLSV
jgi:hypothetical protein